MSGVHDKNCGKICLAGLLFCLLMVCVGTGCSKGLLEKRPDAEKTWVCDPAADEAMRRSDYEMGILLHERFLEKEPSNALALYHLGYAYGQKGEHLKEVSHYEKAISLGFKTDLIFFNLGMTYGELDEAEKSIASFKKALDINADSSDNHFGLAMAYYQMGFNERPAEEEFLKAIAINPANLDARLYLSILYSEMGEIEKANGQLGEILKIEPNHPGAREFLERIKP
jgi:tetratricopeptide (TPR) repeat protein